MSELLHGSSVRVYREEATRLYFELAASSEDAIERVHSSHVAGEPEPGDSVWRLCRLLLLEGRGAPPASSDAHEDFEENLREFAVETSDAMFRLEAGMFNDREFQNALEVIGERYVGLAWREPSPRTFPPHPIQAEAAEEN